MTTRDILLAIHRSNFEYIRQQVFADDEAFDINRPLDQFLHTALHIAVSKSNAELVKFLVRECNADPNIPDINGWTPLAYPVVLGLPNAIYMVELLVNLGADPDLSFRANNYDSAIDMALVHLERDPGLYHYLETAKQINSNYSRRKILIQAHYLFNNSLY